MSQAGPRGVWFWTPSWAKVQVLEPWVQLGRLPVGTEVLGGRRGLMTPTRWQLPAVSKGRSHPVALVCSLQLPTGEGRAGQGLTPFYRGGSRGPGRRHSLLREPAQEPQFYPGCRTPSLVLFSREYISGEIVLLPPTSAAPPPLITPPPTHTHSGLLPEPPATPTHCCLLICSEPQFSHL